MAIKDQMRRLFSLKKQRKELEQQLADTKSEMEFIKNQTLNYLKDNDLQNLTDEEGRCVYQKEPAVHAHINEANMEKALIWLKANGYGYAVKGSIHPKALSRIMKERISQGEPYPEDLIAAYPKESVGLRGS